ncbi:MAG TPA: SDR family oxidoreductase [Solirubrobacterales bacterium]|nr:SDR family oxidoreductase [Solirubrobacterales bacterium]
MSRLPPPYPDGSCLVTGASSGIGAAIAGELGRRGRGVALVARREERLRALAGELADRHGIRAEVLACDLADPGQRRALPARVDELGLRVDTLVNCAGIGAYGPFVELDPERERLAVQLMCEAVVDLCRSFAPAMARRRAGAILLVSSAIAVYSVPGYATYGAAKAFQLSFGEALRAELRSSRVAVTVLCPGPVETEFFAANGPQLAQRGLPRRLWGDPDEVARVAVRALDRNRRVAVPGATMRALVNAGRLLPREVQARALAPALRRFSASSAQA